MIEKQTSEEIVDTTDSLEAVNVFKGMRNLFFFASLIALILLQAIFWLDASDLIDSSDYPAQQNCLAGQLQEGIAPEEAEKTVVIIPDKSELIETPAVSEAETAPQAVPETSPAQTPAIPKVKSCYMVILIRACNFILIISAVLYSLTLLLTIKISLCGRLGGLRHISRGFFTSLLALAFIIPWQLLLKGVLIGAVYTPAELFASVANPNVPPIITEVLYYLRFPGLWLVALFLLLSAQSSSVKWSRTILRRLGLLH